MQQRLSFQGDERFKAACTIQLADWLKPITIHVGNDDNLFDIDGSQMVLLAAVHDGWALSSTHIHPEFDSGGI